jgi:hypothetical protein
VTVTKNKSLQVQYKVYDLRGDWYTNSAVQVGDVLFRVPAPAWLSVLFRYNQGDPIFVGKAWQTRYVNSPGWLPEEIARDLDRTFSDFIACHQCDHKDTLKKEANRQVQRSVLRGGYVICSKPMRGSKKVPRSH